jgi:NAD(P)H dehydrogenase (quinone)
MPKPKHYLFVTAHPSNLGWVNQITDEAVKLVTKKGGKYKLVNLYETSLKQDFLNGTNNTKSVAEYQKMLNWADELVLAYPMWWGSVPAILKNWMDVNFEPKFAYRYIQDSLWYKISGLPNGRLQHIKVSQLVTTGGASWKYLLLFSTPTNLIRLVFIFFCGMRQGWVKMYGNMAKRTEEEKLEMVDDFKAWFSKKI